MIEIQLPCCDGQAVIAPDDTAVQCEACGLVLDLAPDACEARPVALAALVALAPAA